MSISDKQVGVKVRSNRIYTATQYNKIGDHPNEYIWSVAVPILDELPGEENKFPATGRLGALTDCDPIDDLRYSVSETTSKTDKHFNLNLGWWVLERNGKVVAVMPPEQFRESFEVVEASDER